jgi:mannose-6-phosphate isomerase-like protein (cupin superfamily)
MSDASSARPYVLLPARGLGPDASLKASGDSTGGAFTFIDANTDGGAPPHIHEREDEAFYVLEGDITVHCGGEHFPAPQGSFVFLPRGVVHDWDVDGERARVLILAVPGGFDKFLAEWDTAKDWATRDAIGARYGISFPR